MSAALIAAALLVAIGDLALVIASWRSRTVLGALLGAAGVPLVGFALIRGVTRGGSEYSIVIAGITLVMGTVLYAIGQALERVLEDRADD